MNTWRHQRFAPEALGAALFMASFVSVFGQTDLLHSEALLPASARSKAATLFTTLDPAETGVHAPNAFDDPRMWGEEFEEFAYGAIGTGVAAGDVDNDGRVDLFVVGKSDGKRLFRNLGGWRFEDITASSGLEGPVDAWQQGAAFADIDNDGDLDLYICRFNAPNLLYVNRGDGTFSEEGAIRGLAVSDASGMASFADFDRDGWIDVYIATNLADHEKRPDGEPDRLYRNRGDGTFEDVTAAAGLFGPAQTHAAVWWDYNEDHWPDLYATNDFGWPDQLLRNNGNGTFTNTIDLVVPHMPRFSMGADTADVNNDGHVDLLVADMLPTTRRRDQRSMIDARAHQVDPQDPKLTPQYMRNALYLNTGTGRMLEAAYLTGLAATDWTWSVRFEDFDNDGWVDLHVTNGMIREFFDVDLRAQLEGLPPAERRRRIRAGARLDERNLAFRNCGELRFEEVGREWGLDHLGISFGVATADFDGDGDLDLAFSNYGGSVTLCRNDSDTGHRLIIALRGRASNRLGIGAEVRIETATGTQVRQLSPACGYLSSSEPVLHFGLGTDSTVRRLSIRWPSGHEQAWSDLAADRRYLIEEPTGPAPALRPPGPRQAKVQFVEVGGYTKLAVTQDEARINELAAQPLLPFRQALRGPGIAIGDLDGDDHEDVVIGGTGPSAARILRAGDKAQFAPIRFPHSQDPAGQAADEIPVIFDANGDDAPDLFLAKGLVAGSKGDEAYQPRLYLNSGDGALTPAPEDVLPPLSISASAVAVADVNRDGRLDIFIGGRRAPGAYPGEPAGALLINEGGRFRNATAEIAPELATAGLVSSALWTDLDDDGWLDLLVAPHWGPVRAWRNERGARLAEVTKEWGFAAAGSGWWNSLAASDFNGDGRLDYAAGNLGLNTRYRASEDEPVVLLRGDFDGSGRERILEMEYDHGRLVPVRGLSVLSRVFPALRRRFPTTAAYADADAAQVFGEERLAAARRFQVTQLQSGVFLSQPSGGFVFRPLPREAQLAPIQGLVAGDMDGDGRADLYGAQNSYAPIPEIGRFDGGLSVMLRGQGKGEFEVAPLAETNLLVPGDAEAVVVFDPDGDAWPDFLITRSGSRAMVYANTGMPGRRPLRVTLRGPNGNPTGIGARVRAVAADGAVQVAEVAASGGYLSQSSAACFFGGAADNPIKRLHVRWPDGRTSDVALPTPTPAHWEITVP